jgi:hypothetical protein
MQLNIKQFKKWIAALDSGEYNQGHCELQNSGGYCCLGVGCKVTIPKALLLVDPKGFMDGGMPADQPAAPRWLKQIHEDFSDRTGKGLVSLNDTFGFTFSEIATLLELVYIHKILN